MTEAEWLSSKDPERMLAWITCAGPSGDGEGDLERWLRGWLGARGVSFAWPQKGAMVANLLREVLGNPWRPQRLPGLEERCPTCDSPDPARHPAVQFEGEVQVCRDPWHSYNRKCPWLTPTALAIARRAYDNRDFAALPILADALEEAGCDSEDLLRHLRGQEKCLTCAVEGGEAYPVGWCPVCDGTEDRVNGGWMPLRGAHVRGCWALDLILG